MLDIEEPTVSSDLELDDGAYADVDDAQKALILLLEFLLVEYLYRQHAFFANSPAPYQHYPSTVPRSSLTYRSSRSNMGSTSS